MNLGNRNSQHSFAQIPSVNNARSRFDRSYPRKSTLDFDWLNPIFIDEVLPGDTKNLNVKTFIRLATQVVPVLDNMYIDFYFFFVPNRLTWSNWEKLNGAQDNPGDSVDYIMPKLAPAPAVTGFVNGSLQDLFAIPTQAPGLVVNSMPFRAYNLIWNEWFRDQNLQQSRPVNKGNGPDALTDYTLLKAAKKHDYFTSSLPNAQKGNPVTLGIGGTAPIVNRGISLNTSSTNSNLFRNASTNALLGASTMQSDASSRTQTNSSVLGVIDPNGRWELQNTAYADLAGATGITINLLRQGIMMQSLLELDMRGGTRYTEILRAHFDVISPDFRLQRPEFLGGSTIKINQHPVAQTSATTGSENLAQLAAFSTASEMGNKIGFSKSFTEHGYVLGLCRARGEVGYQQGLNRMWSRTTRWDFFWPKFQELGEQTVLMKEIYATGNPALDDTTWGFQERYADYRYRPAETTGQFRSNFAQSLDVWTITEYFGSAPALNAAFIQSNTPIERSLAVAADYPHLLADFFFDYTDVRRMTSYGVPATLGRF